MGFFFKLLQPYTYTYCSGSITELGKFTKPLKSIIYIKQKSVF